MHAPITYWHGDAFSLELAHNRHVTYDRIYVNAEAPREKQAEWQQLLAEDGILMVRVRV